MSKSNQKGKKSTKESFIEQKLKESSIKYNNTKDIEVISRNYLRDQNNNKTVDQLKKISNKIPKLYLVNNKDEEEKKEEKEKKHIKEEKELKKEKEKEEKEDDNDKLTERIKESLPTWHEKSKFIEKIKQLEEQIIQINNDYTNDIQKYKDEIKQKEKDIKNLVKTNNSLKNSLEVLTQRLDKILVNSNQQKIKLTKVININNSQEELQHQLDIKEKELKNQQQLINILSKDNKNIRNILNNFNNYGINESNLNLKDKIQQQYQEIQNLQKNLKEYKLKLDQKESSTQKNISSKNIDFNTDDENNTSPKKLNFFLSKNKKLKLNSGSAYNIHKINKFSNKSQSLDLSKDSQKKKGFRGVNSSFTINNNGNNAEALFSNEELIIIKNSFYDQRKYENFINKINILEKSSKAKEKEMNLKIKMIENKLKEKEKELLELKKLSREKESKIITLNIMNKELKKNKEDLMNKINFMAQTLNELDQKNQMILKKNEQIKNSIFSIDGIIEAKSKDGKTIPLLKEIKNKSIFLEKNNKKNGNESLNQSSRDDKNDNNSSNSD